MEYAETEKEASDCLDTHFISVWEDDNDLVAEGTRELRDRCADDSVHSYRRAPKNHLRNAYADIKINARRKQTYCELCGQRNELAEHLYRFDNNLLDPDDQQEADDKQKTKLQLSHRYCAHHRPRNKDGRTWNPVYKSALQSKEQFGKELRRLQLHVAGAMEYKPVLDDKELKSLSAEELIDRYFYLFLEGKTVTPEHAQAYFDNVKHNFKFPIELEGETKRLIDEAAVRLTGAGTLLGADDEGKLRGIARHMVDSRLTDRKKQILVLKQGLNHTQISERLTEIEGKTISPQTTSKILRAIDHRFWT